MPRLIATLVALLLGTLPGISLAGTYYSRRFLIPDASSVAIAGVNDRGVAAGVYVSPAAPDGAGFIGPLGQTVDLPRLSPPSPNPGDDIAFPTAINNENSMIGVFRQMGQVYDFVWQNGAYTSQFPQSVDAQGIFAPFIGTGDHISGNAYQGHGLYLPFYGTPAVRQTLPLADNAVIASINAGFQIAGQYTQLIGGVYTQSVFAGLGGQGQGARIRTILPPGATSATGGWINDAGQVAGAYTDPAGTQHGFLYTAGHFVSFDMPAPPGNFSVQGIDNTGRVIGAYTVGTRQYGFIYVAGSVSKLGNFNPRDTVRIAISPAGRHIALTRTIRGVSTAWLVHCKLGSGC